MANLRKRLAPESRRPFRYPERKQTVLELPPKQSLIALSKPWLQAMLRETKSSLQSHPHLYLVGLVFITLFAYDKVNFITFLSLGFFSLLMSDHLIENAKNSLKSRREKKKNPASDQIDAQVFVKRKEENIYRQLLKKRETNR